MHRRFYSVMGLLACLLVASVPIPAVSDSIPEPLPVAAWPFADSLLQALSVLPADTLQPAGAVQFPDTLRPADVAAVQTADSLLQTFSAQDLAAAMDTDDMRLLLEELAFQGCYERIELLVMAGKFADALAVSDSTLELAETPANYYYQGLVNECMGAWRRAEWAYSKALKLNPARMDCYLPLVRVLLNLNLPEEAMQRCDKYFDSGGAQLEGLLYRSRAFAMLNEYEEAAADISQVIAMVPEHLDAHRLRAVYYMQCARFDKAVEDWTWLLSQMENPEWMALRADCYAQLGLYRNALDDVRRVVSLTENKENYNGLFLVSQAELKDLESQLDGDEDVKTEYVIKFPPVMSDSVELRVEVVSPQSEENFLPKNLVNDK